MQNYSKGNSRAAVKVATCLAVGVAGYMAAVAQEAQPFQSPRNLLGGDKPSASRGPNTVVVRVNGTPILLKEVEQETGRALAQLSARMPAERLAAARGEVVKNVLDGLVVRHLLLQAAEEKGVQVSPDEVSAAIRQVEGQLPQGQTLETILANQGITVEEFRNNLVRELQVAKLIAEVVAPAAVPNDEEVAAFYRQNEAQMMVPEQVRVRHILIRSSETEPKAMREDKRARAEEVRQKILRGADFVAMVREYSEDPGSVSRGGEYIFSRGQMVPPFEQAAFSQEINAIGPVVETTHGFHIIQVLARQAARKQTLEETAPNIRVFLQNQRRQRLAAEFINARRAASKIEVLENL